MNLRAIIPAMAAFGVLAASAQAQIVEFRGALCLKSVTAACVPEGWGVGDCLLMRYSPRGLGTNGPKTELTVFAQTVADNYSLPLGNPVGTVFQVVNGVHVARIGYTFAAKMRFLTQTPTLTAATPSLTITGDIQDFNNVTGCRAGFIATGANRP